MDGEIRGILICLLVTTVFKTAVSQCAPDSNGVHRFGTQCKYMCHCVNDAACDVDTGECTGGCAAGWFGPACQFWDSVVGLTSRHSDNQRPSKFSYLANDGDSSTCSYTGNIYRTSTNPAFWHVSYTDNITFTEFRIQTTDDRKAMYEGFKVGIEYVPVNLHGKKFTPGANTKTCYQHDGSTITNKVIYVSCDQPLQGNTVFVILATGKTLQLVICDFNVNGGRNLAFDKSATQSSVNGARTAGLAIDGSRTDSNWNYCSVTTEQDNPWWQVNMGFIAYIQSIRITKYNDNNIRDYTVAVQDTGDWRQIYDDSQTAGVVTFVNIAATTRAQWLQIQRNVNFRLVLCEVEVYGECIEDMCGLDCDIPCHCDVPVTMVTRLSGDCGGHCTGRWTGQNGRCDTECTNTQWGPSCENTCGHCSSNEACGIVDGACPNGCQDGFHGSGCTLECGNCKDGSACRQSDGYCTEGCQDGVHGSLCTQECGHCKDGPACRQGDGHCVEGCEAGYKLNKCVDPCDSGYFGPNCAHRCVTCAAGDTRQCSATDGVCKHGCIAGYTGAYCDTECTDNTWGANCVNDCGHCTTMPCNKYNGVCAGGCMSGYKTTAMCTAECDNGTYGVACGSTCNQNCVDVCDKSTGTCSSCKPGYTGTQCEQECMAGYWGQDCNMTCGACNQGTCDRVDGICPNGCAAGYLTTPRCDQACSTGKWGVNCNMTCGACSDTACGAADGVCASGCEPGYLTTSHCDQECSDGGWGMNCSTPCGECNTTTCTKVTGECPHGCVSGYKTSMLCTQACPDGQHGDNCTAKCGKCRGDSVCEKHDGQCRLGCADGYTGDLCVTAAVISPPESSPVGAAVGGSIGSLVVIGLVIAGVILYRRRTAMKPSRPQKFDDIEKPTIAVKPTLSTAKKDTKPAIGSEYVNLGSVISPPITDQDPLQPNGTNTTTDDEAGYYNTAAVRSSRMTTSKTCVPLTKLADYVLTNLPTGFTEEFASIPFGLQHPTDVAKHSGNSGKNRYKDMYAYDHSRVVLKTLKGQPHSDFINACHLDGFNKKKAYIASQGPVDFNVADFWRMVWEQSVHMVVMVTNPNEDNKMKCLEYWGDEVGATREYGYFHVTFNSEDVFADFVVREILIAPKTKPGNTRTIKQLHYSAWPDKDVPSSMCSLNHFWRKVRSNDQQKSHPWVVHCSAGVGRTGTFIAMDYLFDQGQSTGEIDIHACVSRLRDQRVNAVQTLGQYQYLHKLMVEGHVLQSEPVCIDDFTKTYSDMLTTSSASRKSKLQKQYEEDSLLFTKINDIKAPGKDATVEEEDIYMAAKLTENQKKNRFNDILAANNYRPFLLSNVPGCNNYINAVYIPSYKDPKGYIVSQLALENTAIDCCRLIQAEDIGVVVTFQDAGKETVGQYLPEEGTLTLEPFHVTFKSQTQSRDFVTRTHTLEYEGQGQTIKEIVFKKWSANQNLPSDTDAITRLVEEVDRLKRQCEGRPVLIQCLNGAERSGMLTVLLNMFEISRAENSLCIAQIIRHIKLRRHQIVPTFKQYKCCYDVFLAHVESNSTYANL